jgi:hypothetical protein
MPDQDTCGCATCRHLACVCKIQRTHAVHCSFRIAATCPIGIPCEPHGRDCCPICDACTCGVGIDPATVGAHFFKTRRPMNA